jgi:hypothetical protein
MLRSHQRGSFPFTSFALAALLTLGSACSSGDSATASKPKGPSGDEPEPTVTTIIEPVDDLAPIDHTPTFEPDYMNLTAQPWVEPVTDRERDAVEVFPDRLEFPDSEEDVADWEPGRLVVGGPGAGSGRNPMGFARRVVEVEHRDDRYVVTTSVPAIEDILQGDFQLVLDPEVMSEMDLDQADLEWVAENLYYQAPEADLMGGELLIDDWPDGQEPLGFWKKIKKTFSTAGQAINNAAKATASGAVDIYKKVTPETVSGSVRLSPNISISDAQTLFEMEYTKRFNTTSGLGFELGLRGSGDYSADLRMNPGTQVGARIALPGRGAKSSFWLNVDASMGLKLVTTLNLEASIESADGRSGAELDEALAEGGALAQEVVAAQREKLFGDPDMRPQGGWKKTLWVSKPATQTFSAGPVPVVLVQTVQIDLECGFQAKAGVQVVLEFEQNATFKYSVRSDGPGSPPIFDKTKRVNVEVTGGGSVSVNCGLIPRINVFLYDAVGLFAGVRGSLVARAAYESKCKNDPNDFWPTSEMTLGLYGNVGVRAGVRAQLPGASYAGTQGTKLGVEGDVEPWNTEFPLVEKRWSFPRGLGYCLPRCKNLAKDGDETAVDCGGSCGGCSVGSGCRVNSDCIRSVCAGGACSNDHCADRVQDATETDVDCGGPMCVPCAAGQTCSLGSDCESTFCSAWSDEPPACATNHCGDGVMDGDEGGLDCGGAVCRKCADGIRASSASDCESGAWNGTICVASECSDFVRSTGESDVDCGGETCAERCGFKQLCRERGDCAAALRCHPTQNTCLRAEGTACEANGDCVTGRCRSGTCASAATLCDNGSHDGAETDVDCGGPDCSPCSVTRRCQQNADCFFGVCTPFVGSPLGECTAPENLVAAWRFDESRADASGNGHAVLLAGAANYTTSSHSGSAAAAFSTPFSWAAGALDFGDRFTVTSWIYVPSSTLAPLSVIAGNVDPFLGTPSGFLWYVNSPGTTDRSFAFQSSDGEVSCTFASAPSLVSVDSWQHVAVAVDRNTGIVRLYLDGQAVSGSGCVSPVFETALPFTLGAPANYEGSGLGWLDDVRVYGAVLPAGTIAMIAAE